MNSKLLNLKSRDEVRLLRKCESTGFYSFLLTSRKSENRNSTISIKKKSQLGVFELAKITKAYLLLPLLPSSSSRASDTTDWEVFVEPARLFRKLASDFCASFERSFWAWDPGVTIPNLLEWSHWLLNAASRSGSTSLSFGCSNSAISTFKKQKSLVSSALVLTDWVFSNSVPYPLWNYARWSSSNLLPSPEI